MRRVRDDDLLLFPLLGQAQDGFVCVFLVCSVEQGKETGREREIGKRGERKSW